MTITITITKVTQIPASLGAPAAQAAEFSIQNDAVNLTWYKWSMGGIASGADVQSALDANASSLYTNAAAANVTMTQKQVNVGDFAWKHWSNRDVFAAAQYRYTVGMLSGAATLAAYRTVLSDAFAELAPLSGSQFDTEFTNERIALGVNIAIGSMTLAQCQAFATLLDRWLSARRVDCIWAGTIMDLQ